MSNTGSAEDALRRNQQVGINPNDRMPASYSLPSLVAQICARAGMRYDMFDVSQLVGDVDGFMVTNDHAAFTFIRTLGDSFFFDPSQQEGQLRFIHRGGGIVATIDPDDVLESVDEGEEISRKDSINIPRVLNLSYFDLSGGLQPDLQLSDRSLDTRSVGELNLDSPIIFRSNFAKGVAVTKHKIAAEEQRGEYRLELPDSYIDLTVGDVVMYRNERLRVREVQIDEGFQRLRLVHDRGVAQYAFDVEGESSPPPAPVIPIAPGPTRVEVIDTQPLGSADDALGYYLAISGQQPNWRGARIEFSDDGGQTFTASQIGVSDTIMGSLEAPLGSHPRDFPDEHNVLLVRIQTPFSELQSATFREQLNRQNLAIVGNELINFGDVDEVEPGLWALRNLLRGRKGTPATAHLATTRFVLMERQQMVFINAELYELNQPLLFRATSIGSDTITTTGVTFVGRSQRERSVAYLRAIRNGNQVALSWQGVGRFGGRTLIQQGRFFTGYRVQVDGQTIDTAATSANVTVSPGPHTVTVYQRNQLTGNGLPAEIQI